ncbi:MAG: recombinase family protein [Elusimicrobiota bacterium]|jgi:site-specific DNA recombinase
MKSPALGASSAGDADKRLCCGYIRVSSNESAENGHSLAVQKDAIISYAKKNALTLTKIYQDPGISGSEIDNRPGLMSMLEDARAHLFSRVVFHKYDRLSRDTLYALWLAKEFRKYDVDLYSIAEPGRWDNPSEKIYLTIISAFAEFERKRISERLYSGRRKKMELGLFPGGGIPFGYTTKNGELVVSENQANIVKRIFRLRMGRNSFQKIADTLNSENVQTQKHRKWFGSTVRAICKNKTYSGFVKCGEIRKGNHQPIR